MKTLFLLLALTAGALAQQAPPNASEAQRLINALEQQRNLAWTEHAKMTAKAGALEEENARLKAEIEELKKDKK